MTQATIDTSDMNAVHAVFRDALRRAPELITDTADPERAAAVTTYYENVLAFLDVHHNGEDVLLWPTLLERQPEHAALIQEIAAQHDDVHNLTDGAGDSVRAWSNEVSPATSRAAVDALDALGKALLPHLEREEAEILPLAATTFSPQEWGQFPAHGMQHFQGDKIWLLLGLLRDQMTQAQRDDMLAHMPPPAVDFWTNTGEGLYRGFKADLDR